MLIFCRFHRFRRQLVAFNLADDGQSIDIPLL